MGYESPLHLIDIKVKRESVPVVRRILKARKGRAAKSDLWWHCGMNEERT